jgi:hypothetical protein
MARRELSTDSVADQRATPLAQPRTRERPNDPSQGSSASPGVVSREALVRCTAMRPILLHVFLVVALAACSKKANSPAPVTPTPADATMMASCPAGGTPQADSPSCGAVYKGCCFADPAAACAASSCGDKCVQQESMPVQVSCPGEEEPAAAPIDPAK